MVPGEQHRRQRKLLNPVFSTSNMRALLPTLQPIARKLTSILLAKLPDDGCKLLNIHRYSVLIHVFETAHKEIDILPWLSRSALDGVCQAILGYPSDTLGATEYDEYPEALQMMGYEI